MLRNFSRLDGIYDSLSAPKSIKCLLGLALKKWGFASTSMYALRLTIPSDSSFSPKRPSITLYN